MNLLKTIKSNTFALIVAILSVVVQSFHSYTAFYNTSSLQGSGWGIAQAALFAVVIDMAILFYTVRGRKDIALYAAGAMVMINSYYYYQHLGISFEFAFGVFLALIIPTSVYFYSEEIKDEDDSQDKILIRQQLETMKAQQEQISKMQTAYDFLQQKHKIATNEMRDEIVRLQDLSVRAAQGPQFVPYVPTVEEVDNVSEVEYEPGNSHEDSSLIGVYPDDKTIRQVKPYNPTTSGGVQID